MEGESAEEDCGGGGQHFGLGRNLVQGKHPCIFKEGPRLEWISNLNWMSPDWCLAQLSSKRYHLTTDGDRCRDAQPNLDMETGNPTEEGKGV